MTMNSSQLATPDKYNSEHLRLNCLYDEASKTENGIETSQVRQVATTIFSDSSNDLESVIPAATKETRVQHSQESTTLLAESTTDENIHMYQSMQKRIRPSWKMPEGYKQVPFVIFELEDDGSRVQLRQLPLSATTALPDVSEGASTRLSGSNLLSLGRTSSIVAGDMTMNSSQLATPDKYNSEHLRLNCLYDEASKTENGIETSQLRQVATTIFSDSSNDLESVIPAATRETRVQHSQESTTLLAESTTHENIHMYQSMQTRIKTQINQSEHTPLSTPTVPKAHRPRRKGQTPAATPSRRPGAWAERPPSLPCQKLPCPDLKNAVCEVCGAIGYEHLLLCCSDCKGAHTHQYCLEKVLYKAPEEWFCDECIQRRKECSYSRFLGKGSTERPSKHAQFDFISQQPITSGINFAAPASPQSPATGITQGNYKQGVRGKGCLEQITTEQKKT